MLVTNSLKNCMFNNVTLHNLWRTLNNLIAFKKSSGCIYGVLGESKRINILTEFAKNAFNSGQEEFLLPSKREHKILFRPGRATGQLIATGL